MSGVLEGIRVVEVASMAAAPSATVILADHGAEVIKIEPPSGDPWRYGHKVTGMPPSDIPWTTYIQNRGKKSVVLDLKKPEAQEALGQPKDASLIVGLGGFLIALEVDQVGAEVEPGDAVLRVLIDLILGGIQRFLAVVLDIPVFPQYGFHGFFLVSSRKWPAQRSSSGQ